MNSNSNTSSNNNSRCPCCSFDLFLPPSEKDVDSKVETTTAANAMKCSDDKEDSPQNFVEVASHLSSVADSLIVDTHGHAQLNRDREDAYDLMKGDNVDDIKNKIRFKSLACSVEPADFETTLQYSATSDSILPALGVHPWYIENLSVSKDDGGGDDDDSRCWLDEMERRLVEHPACIVGEIGLCKVAKWVRLHPDGKSAAMDIQRRVFQKQMELAAKLHRPVSVHCVNSHGIFMSVMKDLMESSMLPPAIGMHSFTGTAHHVRELLDLEDEILSMKRPVGGSRGKKNPLFYFGFSHLVNYSMCSSEKSRRKGCEAVRAVPINRLMVESDVHNKDDVLGGTIAAIAYVAWARRSSVKEIADVTARNGLTFMSCGSWIAE